MAITISADPVPLRDFTDLDVWKAARDLRYEIYKLAQRLPDFEKLALASQLRRAAVSVTANIAEGFGRYSYQENAQFCRQARGSVYELRDHLITCRDEHHLGQNEFTKLDEMAQRVAKLLNGYLCSTLARKQPNPQISAERETRGSPRPLSIEFSNFQFPISSPLLRLEFRLPEFSNSIFEFPVSIFRFHDCN